MSRKHFQALADEIRFISDLTARKIAAQAVASACAQCNNRFDYGRFYSACGVE
jgi:hypothetical protein